MTELKLYEHQYAVGQALLSTGIVLKKNHSLYLTGDSIIDIYEVFDSYDDAKRYAVNMVQNSNEIECWIKDSQENTVFVYDKNGERKI